MARFTKRRRRRRTRRRTPFKRRRRTRRRRGGMRLSTRRVRGLGRLWPDKLLTKMVTTVTLIQNASVFSVITFSGNDCNDPFILESALQPMGYDELKAQYARTKVNASAISFMGSSRATTSIVVCILPDLDSAPPTTINGFQQNLYSKSRFFSGQTNIIRLRSFMTLKKLFGGHTTDEDFEANTDFSPDAAHSWSWHIAFAPTQAIAMALDLNFTMTYWVEWFHRISIGTS